MTANTHKLLDWIILADDLVVQVSCEELQVPDCLVVLLAGVSGVG